MFERERSCFAQVQVKTKPTEGAESSGRAADDRDPYTHEVLIRIALDSPVNDLPNCPFGGEKNNDHWPLQRPMVDRRIYHGALDQRPAQANRLWVLTTSKNV
jgi:hypothetical protein